MNVLQQIRRSLREPLLDGVDVEQHDRLAVHGNILARKKMLRGVFEDIYRKLMRLDQEFFSGPGRKIEIGAGVSRFKELCPELVQTDVVPADHLDMVLDAHAMDLPDNSVRVFFGLNCFHHFHDPAAFFREVERVVVPGGGCILVEPYHGPLASLFYKNVFDTEDFAKDQESWESESGVMEGANQALSYIVFQRDRERFQREFPGLELVKSRWLANYPRYLLSGGLNFRQLLPDFFIPILKGLEFLGQPLGHFFALHHYVVLRKTGGPLEKVNCPESA